MNDASGETVYTYDVRHRLASKQTPFGTLSYTYDNASNLLTTRSSNANGISVDYSYDVLNRLSTVKDNRLLALNGGLTTYDYDAVGNLESYQYPNGVTTSYQYNTLNRLTSMSTASGGGGTLSSYSYTLGPAGNRTAVSELGGRTVSYTYDDLYRLTNETIANDPHGINGAVGYDYDAVGNRLSRTSSVTGVPSQSSTYDTNDRLGSDTYDANGNTTAANSNSYGYDFENRLTSLNNGSVTYVYDGDGNRVSKTVSGVTTNYLVDTNNHTGYAQVVEELQSGSVTKQFTFGHDLISQRIIGGALSFYSYDGHGSVRQLTDSTSSVTDTYDYDAFGILIHRTGTTPNDYLYSGEQFDTHLGFYYLRARYMNPSTGRFWIVDRYEGTTFDPISLHKYLYGNANPITYVDPTGHMSATERTGVLLVAATLFTIATLTLVQTLPKVIVKTETSITLLPPRPTPTPEPSPLAPPLVPLPEPTATPAPDQQDACDCFNKEGASPVLLEGSIDGPYPTHWGRLHIAQEHGYGMNPRKGQFRLGLVAAVPLAQLLEEGVSRARMSGKIWTASADRANPSIIYCILNTDSDVTVGTSYYEPHRTPTNKFRIVADPKPPYAVITMFPR